MLSWNAGHLGVQQWAEVTAWLHTGASDSCDVMALQETHWNGRGLAMRQLGQKGHLKVKLSPDNVGGHNNLHRRRIQQ